MFIEGYLKTHVNVYLLLFVLTVLLRNII